jgi:hypothetical protein
MSLQRRVTILTVLAVALFLAAVQSAQAGFGDFTISTQFTTPTGGTITAPSGDSTVNFLPPNGANSVPGTAPTSVIFAQLQLVDNSVATTYTDTYSIPYVIAVTLTDEDTGGKATFDITGTLTGSITDTNGSFSASFSNSYSAPLSQTRLAGKTNYTLTVANASGFFTTPSPPSGADGVSSTNGTFAVMISAAPNGVPEPTSLALLGIGGLLAIGVLRRRNRAS